MSYGTVAAASDERPASARCASATPRRSTTTAIPSRRLSRSTCTSPDDDRPEERARRDRSLGARVRGVAKGDGSDRVSEEKGGGGDGDRAPARDHARDRALAPARARARARDHARSPPPPPRPRPRSLLLHPLLPLHHPHADRLLPRQPRLLPVLRRGGARGGRG